MNEKKNEEQKTEKPQVKLPQFQSLYQHDLITYTDKGPCMWLSPAVMDLNEVITYIDLAKSKFEEQIEINKKKEEEEAEKNKPPVENKEQSSNYKSV